ncbi:MAG TPA: hypothetical protein VM621_08090 [Luteibacter sp.]|uniref:hypothetical protein n=1 Tax=Luteibacter sp. TaxID=1886636 RepID=UPI002C1CCF34|nr:hypothetical protein [Luteibacter sp.]HVI54996.1 hypothetical protein [Luteibacter sp.]
MKKMYMKACAAAAATFVVIGMSAWSSLVKADDRSVVTVSSMSIDSRHDIERRVDEIANHIANAKPYFEDDRLPIHIKSRFDPVAQSLVMSIDERFGPVSGLVEMEELQSDVTYALWPMLEKIQGFWGLDWRYGGKDMYFWFPGDRRAPEKPVLTKAVGKAGRGSV